MKLAAAVSGATAASMRPISMSANISSEISS
jgi:hypothetical protein